jgi:DNA polymerase I-like protein with 3'-5' exonuclease and polymerase domains
LNFWERDPQLAKFFADHDGDTFLAHYSVAEMKYLLRLGVPLPRNWFDTFVAWRYFANAPGKLEAGLTHALHTSGLPHLAPVDKKELQQKILHLEFNSANPRDRQEITDYCFSDCDGCLALYQEIDAVSLLGKMGHWAPFFMAVARMELRGIPFDSEGYWQIRKHKGEIQDSLTADLNGVYQGGSFNKARFLEWCDSEGIRWPLKQSKPTRVKAGKPDKNTRGKYHPMDNETFKEMQGRHSFIGEVRQLRKTLASFSGRSLTVDNDRIRHYFSTNIFRAVTSRNQPRKFVFSGPKWLRCLVVPESPDHLLVHVDYTAQEIGIAAALSGDRRMQEIYETDDCHMAFAIRAGAAPVGATKETHPEIRKRYKAVNLGVQYGQTPFGIARNLGISKSDADALLRDHRSLFSTFWEWSEELVQGSFDRGWIKTPCGWRSEVPLYSNDRTWMNWPMQATGADMMRLTVTYFDRQNVQLLAPMHDSFLLSCRRSELAALRSAVDGACQTAVEQVIPGFPMRWDIEVHEGRFEDSDGIAIWGRLQGVLSEILEK